MPNYYIPYCVLRKNGDVAFGDITIETVSKYKMTTKKEIEEYKNFIKNQLEKEGEKNIKGITIMNFIELED